jgi:hypothetical protein
VRRRGTLAVGTLGVAVLLVVAWVSPADLPAAIHVVVPILAGLAIWALALDVLGEPAPAVGTAVRRRRAPRNQPAELRRIEAGLAVSPASAMQTHHRLRPVLREIAMDRLRVRRRIDLDGDPARARAALGDEAWGLVRPDRSTPIDRVSPGISLDVIARVVERLESI